MADIDTREEPIRQAMIDLCFEEGYGSLTLPALLERAEVAEEEFHRDFSDLEDCFAQTYLGLREDFLGRVRAAIADQPSWRDRIRATAYVLLRFLSEDPKITHFTAIEVRFAGERPQLLLDEAIQRLFDLIDEGRADRPDPDSLTRSTAEAVGGGILMQVLAAVERGDLAEGEQAIPQLMYSAVLPYLGPAEAEKELHIPPPPAA